MVDTEAHPVQQISKFVLIGFQVYPYCSGLLPVLFILVVLQLALHKGAHVGSELVLLDWGL